MTRIDRSVALRLLLSTLTLIAATLGAANAEAQCRSQADCRQGRTCQAGVCAAAAPTCARDIDCPAGNVCTANACVAAVGYAAPPITYGAPAAQPDRIERKPIKSLVISGAILFGLNWLVGAGVTVAIDTAENGEVTESSRLNFIPVAGPWVVLATQNPSDTYVPLLAAQGALQLAGIAMFTVGLAVRPKHRVSAGFMGDSPKQAAPIAIAPVPLGSSGAGLGMRIGEM